MESNKRIVFFSVFPPYRGGISKFSNSLAKELNKCSDLISINFKQQYPTWLFPGKSQYGEEKPYSIMKRVGSTFNPLSFRTLNREIRKNNPEKLVCSYWVTFMAPLLSFVANRQDSTCEKILLVHNFIPHESRFFDPFMNRLVLRAFDKFIVLSDKVGQEIHAINPKAEVVVAKHPVYKNNTPRMLRNEANKVLGLNPDKHTLLFFGLIRDYKGLDLLLEAFSLMGEHFQLIIAGEVYGNSKKYEDLISKSSNKNILFHNFFVPEKEVHLYFSASDLCVLPYKSGTQSGVKSTADDFGIPCLISNVGGIAEDIEHTKNGFIISSLEPLILKEQMENIFLKGNLSAVARRIQENNANTVDEWQLIASEIIK